MTPKSFDIDTAKEMIGDARMRVIEAKARADTEVGVKDTPKPVIGSYWDRIRGDMEYIIYIYTHQKRTERMERLKENA